MKLTEQIAAELTEALPKVEGDLEDFKSHIAQIEKSLMSAQKLVNTALALAPQVLKKADSLGDPGWQKVAWSVYHEAHSGSLAQMISAADDIVYALQSGLKAK